MLPSHHRALADPGESGIVKQPYSPPVGSYHIRDYDSKMTWVRSTLTEILRLRLHLLDTPMLDCDQRTLSLHPPRQSRATWCTNDLHTLLMYIYEQYGPPRMVLEGPNRRGLSWIKFYKLFNVEQGRTKQLVHIIWVKPGEVWFRSRCCLDIVDRKVQMLAKRVHERITAEAGKLQGRLSPPRFPTLGECTIAYERSAILSANPTTEVFADSAIDAIPTADSKISKGVSSLQQKPQLSIMLLLCILILHQRLRFLRSKLYLVNATLITDTAASHTQPFSIASAPNPSTMPGSDKWRCLPYVVTKDRAGAELRSEGCDGPRGKATAQKPTEAKGEDWGIVSCLSIDSMDGDWILTLDEDLTW